MPPWPYRSPHMGPMRLNVLTILIASVTHDIKLVLLLVQAVVDRAVHHRPIS